MRTNHFYLEKAEAKTIAVEILGTHFGMSPPQALAWLDDGHFE